MDKKNKTVNYEFWTTKKVKWKKKKIIKFG